MTRPTRLHTGAAHPPSRHDGHIPTSQGGVPYTAPTGDQTWCQANSTLYLTVLSNPPGRDASPDRHADYRALTDAARDWCSHRCPRFAECLRDALAGPEVDGFVAGTTDTERRRLRRTLGVTPQQVDIDRAAGTQPKVGDAFSIERTAQMVAAHPQETNVQLAERLGCSPVTVKRHRAKIAKRQPRGDGSPTVGPQQARAAYRDLFGAA